ncbi:MAG: TlpA family protein disulfide reductase [Actinomycetales bacterium]|nr:TlpA family protein disulfide reductase [Actinomycetales bacterium]
MPRIFRRKAILAAASIVILSLSLSGCAGNDPLAQQYRSGDNKNYIAGDGTVTEYGAADRGASVAWQGKLADGSTLSSANLSGVVTVMNFWYAGCAPCRAEAPDLVALAKQFPKVQFVGVNVRDAAGTAGAFERKFGIRWPSILDAGDGSVVLAFTGIVTPQAVPTTLVIDAKGRVAARVLGRVEPSTVKALIKRVVDEG